MRTKKLTEALTLQRKGLQELAAMLGELDVQLRPVQDPLGPEAATEDGAKRPPEQTAVDFLITDRLLIEGMQRMISKLRGRLHV